MRAAVKALSVLSTLLWLVLIGLVVSSFYFAATGGVIIYVGEPYVEVEEGLLAYVAYVHVRNHGLLSLQRLILNGTLVDSNGHLVGWNETLVGSVGPGREETIRYAIYLNLTEIGSDPELSYLMEEAATLNMTVVASVVYSYLFPLRVKASYPVEWSPPLENLHIIGPNLSITGTQMSLGIYFTNKAVFDLRGDVDVHIYDAGGDLLGSGTTGISVQRGEKADIQVVISLDKPLKPPISGTYVIVFRTDMFRYEVVGEYELG